MCESTKSSTLKQLISKYNIRPTKSLGQNFLVDDFALNSIINALDIKENDMVIEIGAGLGALSKGIAVKTDNFIAIEIDKHLIPPLSYVLKEHENSKIINADFLKLDIKAEISSYLESKDENSEVFEDVKVVGNLPYYITTPIMMRLLEMEIEIETIVLMVQKEVVERMVAKPSTSEYGPLAIFLQHFYNIEVVFDVPPHCFSPKPNVFSTVVKLTRLNKSEADTTKSLKVNNSNLFVEVVKASFAQRRKTLLNSLSNSLPHLKTFQLDLSKENIRDIMNKLEIDENIRGEALTVEQYVNLTNSIGI